MTLVGTGTSIYGMNKRTPKLGHNIQLSVEASEYLKVLCHQLDKSKSGVVEYFILLAKNPPKEPKNETTILG